MFQIALRSSADGRSKKNVPNVNQRRSSGGRLVIECTSRSRGSASARSHRRPEALHAVSRQIRQRASFASLKDRRRPWGCLPLCPPLSNRTLCGPRRTDKDEAVGAMILHPAQHGSGHLGLDARHIGAYDHIILDFDRKSCAWRRYEHQHLTTCL